MTRADLIARYRNELFGLICDAALSRAQGGELAVRLRQASTRVDEILGQIYHDLRAAAPVNGKPAVTPSPVRKGGTT